MKNWTSNLSVFVEGDYIFIQPKKHAKIWDSNHSFAVKRAGSIIVIHKGVVQKNLLY